MGEQVVYPEDDGRGVCQCLTLPRPANPKQRIFALVTNNYVKQLGRVLHPVRKAKAVKPSSRAAAGARCLLEEQTGRQALQGCNGTTRATARRLCWCEEQRGRQKASPLL